MIESCLASIAVCLPVLHGLFRKISLKAVICSVRSITPRGLTLVGLQGSRASNTATARIKSDNNSTSSHARILPSHLETTTVEVYAMRDCSTTPENQMVPQGEILVGSTVTQSQYTAWSTGRWWRCEEAEAKLKLSAKTQTLSQSMPLFRVGCVIICKLLLSFLLSETTLSFYSCISLCSSFPLSEVSI